MAGPQTFSVELELLGKTATGFRVPSGVMTRLSERKRLPVLVTIGDYTYRSTTAVYGEEFLLPLNRSNREAAGVEAGEMITVTLAVDEEPRVIVPPDDLAVALLDDAIAGAAFDRLSYSHQREYVEWIEEAKRVDTRQRRITKTIAMLKEGRTQR